MKTIKKKVQSKPKGLSIDAPASTKGALEYDKDFAKWALKQARFLKRKEFSKLDIDNLIEEIEDLSKREKQRLMSYLENLLMHKLKVKFQKLEIDSVSWALSIEEAGRRSQKALSENPSLKLKIKDIVEEAYSYARLKAAKETRLDKNIFPKECPWSLKEIFPDLEKKYC
jgi:hypothetical protein